MLLAHCGHESAQNQARRQNGLQSLCQEMDSEPWRSSLALWQYRLADDRTELWYAPVRALPERMMPPQTAHTRTGSKVELYLSSSESAKTALALGEIEYTARSRLGIQLGGLAWARRDKQTLWYNPLCLRYGRQAPIHIPKSVTL